MRNRDIIQVSMPEEMNAEGIRVQVLKYLNHRLVRGVNIQEVDDRAQVCREIYLNRTEIRRLVPILTRVLLDFEKETGEQ